jgi:hypothetical protein
MTDEWGNDPVVQDDGWGNDPVTDKLPAKYVGPSPSGGANKTPQEEMLSTTSVGRVLDAFGEGASDGWGAGPVGLSSESEQYLRDIGIWASVEDTWTRPFQAFNEAILRPAAGVADSLLRVGPAAIRSVAAGAGQVGEELGLIDTIQEDGRTTAFTGVDPKTGLSLPGKDLGPIKSHDKARFVDSIDEFLEISSYVLGGDATFYGTQINVPKARSTKQALKDVNETIKANDPLTVPKAPGADDISSSVLAPGSEIVANTPKKPTDIVSAIKLGDDDVVIGKVGEEHKDVFNRALQERGMDFADQIEAMNDGQTIDAYGFYDTVAGKFLTDKEALQQAKEFGLTPPDSRAATRFISPEVVQQQERYLKSSGKPTDLVPAITMPGEKPVLGLPGEIHNDIFLRMAAERGDDFVAKYEAMTSGELDATHNYVDIRTNKTLTDKEANAAAKDYGLEPSVGPWLPSPRLINQQKAYLAAQENQPKSLGAAATPPEKLAQPITSAPVGANPKFTKPDGTVDTTKIGEMSDVYGAIDEMSQAGQGYGPLATRGEVTWAQTEELAQTAGVQPEVLLKRGIGEAWNAEQLEAAQNLLLQGADDLVKASRKARETGSDADVLAAVEAFQRASLFNEAVTGLKTEAGRALAILRKHKEAMAEVQDLKGVLDELGGKASWEEILGAMDKLDATGDMKKVNRFVADLQKPGAKDMVLEYMYNAMLSNPVTHGWNLVGNSLALLWEPGVALGQGAIGATRAALGSKSALAGQRAYMGEAPAMLWGILQGFPEGLKVAWQTVKEGKAGGKAENFRYRLIKGPDGKTKWVKSEINHAIPNATWDLTYIGKDGKVVQTPMGETVGMGSIIRTPTTMLSAADELFKAMAYRASINQQAYRIAAKKGLKGDDFIHEVAKQRENPTKKMMETAKAKGDYTTFTRELGTLGKSAQRFLEHVPVLKFVLAPFFRTPVNLIKHPLEHSVFSLFSKEVQDTAMGKNGKIARDEVYTRILMGSGVTASAYALAMAGKLTGAGPEDPRDRAGWLATGKQPYSVRIGENWVPYARLEPFATLLGIAADFAYIRGQADFTTATDIGTLAAYSASQTIMNKTWLQGITDIVEAVNDPDRHGGRYVNRLLTRAIPAASAQLARNEDPYLRDARTLLDAAKVKIPGKSQEIQPQRDVFGQPIERNYITKINKDPVVNELVRLDTYPADLERKIRGVELTPEQYDEYQIMGGALLRTALEDIIMQPFWGSLPDGIKMDMIRKRTSRTREQASKYMLMTNPDLLIKSMENKYNHLTGTP